MKKLLTAFVFLLPLTLLAQQQIKGMIKDEAGQLLDAVTVTLSEQSNNISYALADSGRFSLNYKTSGNYTITATLTGYKTLSKAITLPSDTLLLILQIDSHQLAGVVVSAASKPIIERKIDRVTFNVENSIVASGGTAWDALGKAPGVQVKPDNSLSANKKSVKVYVDGKPLNLSGDDLANYLQGLPSDLVSKIEVFSNPPANFDAEGGGVINIITKKTKGQGFNATLNGAYTQATYGSYTSSTSFNYRKDKLNIYGSYGYTDKHFGRDQHDYVTYADPGNTSFWDSPGYDVMKSEGHNYRLGADYQLSNNQILGVLVTSMNRVGSTTTYTPTTVTNNNHVAPDSTLVTNGITNSKSYRYDYNLNYNLKIDGGKSLNVDVDYSPFQFSPKQYVQNVTFLSDGNLSSSQYHIYTPTVQAINIYAGKIDYNYKIGKIWSLTSGIKYSSIQSRNDFDFYNIASRQPILVAANSDHFQYKENTAAVYSNFSGSLGKWAFQGGLRGELTNTRGYSATLDSLNTRQYFKLFPTLYAVYKLNEDNQLQLTYSYRVDRPGYAYLNPAKHYATPYNYLQGNPNLQPAFVQNIELGYTFKKQFNLTAYYTSTHDFFSNVTVQDNINHLFFDTFRNLGLSLNTGLRLSAPIHFANWWEMSLLVEGYYQREASNYLQGSYDYRKFSYDVNTTQSFTINKKMGLRAELTAIYNAPGIQGIFKADHNSEVDAGIKTNILKGQGTLKLAFGDIFFSNTYHISVDYLNQNNGFYQRNDTRNATLSFTYRFGKNVAAVRKRSTSNEEESKRAQ